MLKDLPGKAAEQITLKYDTTVKHLNNAQTFLAESKVSKINQDLWVTFSSAVGDRLGSNAEDVTPRACFFSRKTGFHSSYSFIRSWLLAGMKRTGLIRNSSNGARRAISGLLALFSWTSSTSSGLRIATIEWKATLISFAVSLRSKEYKKLRDRMDSVYLAKLHFNSATFKQFSFWDTAGVRLGSQFPVSFCPVTCCVLVTTCLSRSVVSLRRVYSSSRIPRISDPTFNARPPSSHNIASVNCFSDYTSYDSLYQPLYVFGITVRLNPLVGDPQVNLNSFVFFSSPVSSLMTEASTTTCYVANLEGLTHRLVIQTHH